MKRFFRFANCLPGGSGEPEVREGTAAAVFLPLEGG